MRSTPRNYDFAASGLAAILSAVELIRLILAHGVSRGLTTLTTVTEGIIFSAVLAATAIGMALHRQIGWMVGVLAVLIGAAHGVILRAAGNGIGIVYMIASLVLLGLLIRSLHWYRGEIILEV
jgi:hypothetical protein